jgi:hypothetical protein
VTAAAGPYARLDELTAIAGRFEDELIGRPSDRERLALGHGRAMAARSAEIDQLLAAGVPAADISVRLDRAGQ